MTDHKCNYSKCDVVIPAGDNRIYHSKACSQAAYRERLASQTDDELRLKVLQKSLAKDRDKLAALTFDFTDQGKAEYERTLGVIRRTKDAIMKIHTDRLAVIEDVSDSLYYRKTIVR